MRFEICASVTLLAVQLSLPKYRSEPFSEPASSDQLRAPGERHHAGEAAKLEALWRAHNAAFHAPPCAQYDPLAVLDADVDPTPGREHVIGNRQFGVAMYAEDGLLIARAAPVGCAEDRKGDQSLSLSSFGPRLVIHTRDLRDDGVYQTAHVVTRNADELAWFAIDLGGDRGDRQWSGAMSFRAGEVEVKYHGRQRGADGAWEAVDDHCTWDLATRISACRTRAAARR